MQNEPEVPMTAAGIMTALREQLAGIQKSFTDALEQNQATLNQRQAEQEARYQQLIEDLQEEVRALKMPTLGL